MDGGRRIDSEETDDLLITASGEVKVRKHLTQVALGRKPADLAIRVGRLFDVFTRTWADDQEIVISGRRIAWVGPAGEFTGAVAERRHYPNLSAVPGFGEVHKHIESSHLTPEWEAALVVPRGNTWTCEASHEFANVNGERNLDMWFEARKRGSPLKIFILPGSAVPPSAYEHGGGRFDYEDQKRFLESSLMVAGLDEVMDWPAVSNPDNPSHDRLWGMIEASFECRGVIEGHGAGLNSLPDVNAFAASGLSSDHEIRNVDEAWNKLSRGIFLELRPQCYDTVITGLLERGLSDWSNIALTTDDRSATETLAKGATEYNARVAIQYGLSPEVAFQCLTINPARHMRIDAWVGSLAPGRFADIVLLSDTEKVDIAAVYTDGKLACENGRYMGPIPQITWPEWATKTIKIDHALTADDFRIEAEPGRETMSAALLRPFHFHPEFIRLDLPVKDGAVQRDESRLVTKFAIVDRFSGGGQLSCMFWKGCGPRDPDTALACSVAHDKHNIWVIGSSDEAMAMAVNRLREIDGGWALVRNGKVAASVRYEVGGLMTARPHEALDAETKALYAAAEGIDWMFEQGDGMDGWGPGFPDRLIFATLTCSPWHWVLVAPCERAPKGFVNVQTGETHPVVW
jgi:adenine deaminase